MCVCVFNSWRNVGSSGSWRVFLYREIMQLMPKIFNPHVIRKFFDLQVVRKGKTGLILKAFPMNLTPKELGLFQSGNIVPLGRYSFCFNFFIINLKHKQPN